MRVLGVGASPSVGRQRGQRVVVEHVVRVAVPLLAQTAVRHATEAAAHRPGIKEQMLLADYEADDKYERELNVTRTYNKTGKLSIVLQVASFTLFVWGQKLSFSCCYFYHKLTFYRVFFNRTVNH